MPTQCTICGSRFASKHCYFCESNICSSCIAPADVTGNNTTIKCIECDKRRINKISLFSVIRRNKIIIGILLGFWIFTVYPIPFLQMLGYRIDPSVFQPVLIATVAMTIPFVFMFVAWQKRAPKSGGSDLNDTYQGKI
jgi:uncharacterized membrane protein